MEHINENGIREQGLAVWYGKKQNRLFIWDGQYFECDGIFLSSIDTIFKNEILIFMGAL